jgi:serine/threonine protein kinase
MNPRSIPLTMINHPDFSGQKYQVIRELGRNREGGRISYLAEALIDRQQVVIKQFRFAQENASWQGFKIYEREILILQELNHPRIPRYLDSFETQDGFCMVQEYKSAPTLATRSSFTPLAIQDITISILEILVDLQQRIPPIIHRDIKPENILVDDRNQAYLIDFGLARVNSSEVAMSSVMAGTPGFMPPEELFNRPLTTASDLYSLGATVIALLTNTAAIDISKLMDETYQFQFRHLITGVNPDFLNWLQKMVAPNPKDRYVHAAIALQDLAAIDIMGRSQAQIPKQQPIYWMIAIGMAISFFATVTPEFLRRLNTSTPTVANSSHTNASSVASAEQWFSYIKPSCNAVEVVTIMRSKPHPSNPQGVGYAASCYALAGRIDLADQTIQQLPVHQQESAAIIVFNIGHPVADAGDDRSAGPIMELVLRYQPSNFMALYHAGMSSYVLGDYPRATQHLQSFLKIYQPLDGWTERAKFALFRMQHGIPADKSFSVHNG